MAISSTQSYVEYTGDSSTTSFTIPFYFLLNSDISVMVADADGNITELTNGTDFTVTGQGVSTGGTCVLNTAYSNSYSILVYREPPETQETKYYENGKFPAKSHESALDKLTMLIQRFGWMWDSLALKRPNFFADFYDANGHRISDLQDPKSAQDAATKNYVDTQVSAEAAARALADSLLKQRDDQQQVQIDQNASSYKALIALIGQILSGEYTLLGDYSAGPYTFSAYNQLITKGGYFYALKSSVTLPYTTTGNTATTWATDEANFVAVGDAILRQELASGVGFNLIGTVYGVDKLSSISNPKDGDRVLLDGYYSDWRTSTLNSGWAATALPPSGGGILIYDSSLSGTNNGVTIFNGWVRDLSSRKLTTFDAGLVGGDGSDATTKLNTLCSVMQDGFTLEIHGYHQVNKIVMMTHKSDVVVKGVGGTISAKEAGADFTFQLNFDSREAILHTVYCDYIEIYNLNIIGCKQINFAKYAPESGDAGIIVWNSKAPKVHDCNITNVQTWGIAGWGVPGAEIYDNDISYLGTQSGIAVNHTSSTDGITGASITPIVSNGCNVYRNKIKEGGLYAVEFEGDGDALNGRCFENISVYTKWGVAVVNMQSATAHDNQSSFCYAGIFVGGAIANREAQGTKIYNNTSTSDVCGILAGAASYTQIYGNDINTFVLPGYVIDNQYCFIRAFGSSNQFYLYSWANESQYIKAGATIQIRDTIYTISTVAASTVPDGESVSWATAGYRTLVTLTSDLGSDVQLYDHIKVGVALNNKIATRGIWTRDNVSNDNANPDSCIELDIFENRVKSAGYGVYPASTYSATTVPTLRIVDNNFQDCTYWLREFRQGYLIKGNKHTSSDLTSFNSGNQMSVAGVSYFKNIYPLRKVPLSFPSKTASATAQIRHFSIDDACVSYGVEVGFDYPACTGDIYISINGSSTNRYVISQSTFAGISDQTMRRFTIYGPVVSLWPQWFYLTITSSTGDLSYTAVSVSLLTM